MFGYYILYISSLIVLEFHIREADFSFKNFYAFKIIFFLLLYISDNTSARRTAVIILITITKLFEICVSLRVSLQDT